MREIGKYIIKGGNRLEGKIDVHAAKNAVLPIIACSVMIKGEVVLHGIERLTDIDNMLKIVRSLGGKCSIEDNDVIIDCTDLKNYFVDKSLTGALRSSVFILGPLLSRLKKAKLCYPGGCDIGLRPIDLHLDGLRALGVKLTESPDCVTCDGEGLTEGEVHLVFPSVGATENLIMVATLTKGTTVIHGVATEPEIVDLQNFINAMGGKVFGAGSPTIVIEGVGALHGGEYTPIGDRIVAGTYLILGALCGGNVAVHGVPSYSLTSLYDKLRYAGADVAVNKNEITVKSDGNLRVIKKVETGPYPDFPTDLQAPITAMMASSHGRGYVIENLFENRFRHTGELIKMGADITVCGRAATVRGKRLHGAKISAEDLRGGAALVIAALAAEGESEIIGLPHIDRGYYKFEDKLNFIGGNVKRVNFSCI